jgi:hypothetical protein
MSDLTARLDAIQAQLDAATPGKWEVTDGNEGEWPPRPLWMVTNDEFHNPGSDEEPWLAVELHTGVKEDAVFIAAAPENTRFLLDLARKQQAAIDAVEDWMRSLDVIEELDPTTPTNRNCSAGGVASMVRASLKTALEAKP